MKSKVNQWVDQFPGFHELNDTEQIVRLVYFHTIEEKRETVTKSEIEQLFEFVDLPVPANLAQMLVYLAGKGNRLINKSGEYSLRREVRQSIETALDAIRGVQAPPKVAPVPAFEFPGRAFKDKKVEVLLLEATRCYGNQCWNACGILMRIVLERTLDSADPRLKATPGLKAKLNAGTSTPGIFSKTIVDALRNLGTAKLLGDIVAHHSTIVLDKPDVDLVAPSLRMLIKEVTTV
jgi:hypothetical protein